MQQHPIEYPKPVFVMGVPTNYLIEGTPVGKFGVLRELSDGGLARGYEFVGTARQCLCFIADKVIPSDPFLWLD
jgi:hypothetical protein